MAVKHLLKKTFPSVCTKRIRVISIPQRGGVERILSLKEWLKSPWTLVDEI